MHQSLVLQIRRHLLFEGLEICEYVPVRDDDAFWLRRCARSENDLQHIVALEFDAAWFDYAAVYLFGYLVLEPVLFWRAILLLKRKTRVLISVIDTGVGIRPVGDA